MKKIKIFPAPHTELRVLVSDEMVKDYRECAEMFKMTGQGKCCDTCSWDSVRFGDICLCILGEMHTLLEDKDEKED